MTDNEWLEGVIGGAPANLFRDERYGAGVDLVRLFTDFFAEVARFKEAIGQGRLAAVLGSALPAQPSTYDMAAAVSGFLMQHLRRLARQMPSATDEERRTGLLVRYVMAALADETFLLDVKWAGSEHWLSCLIEWELFDRRDAGESFFVLVDSLFGADRRSPAQAELATVFLLALHLGFQGRHRGPAGADDLLARREQLRRFIDPAPRPHAFAQAYECTVTMAEESRLAPLAPWYRAGLVAAAAYLVISTVIWFYTVSPLTQAIDQYAGSGG